MAECGKPVGKGVVNYPCAEESGHEGPCASKENAASQRERARWLKTQAAPSAAGVLVAPMVSAMSGVVPCAPCKEGVHEGCEFPFNGTPCGCFQSNMNSHLGIEEVPDKVEITCPTCRGFKVIASRTAFTEALGLEPEERRCADCDGKGFVLVARCAATFPDAFGTGAECILAAGHEGKHDAGGEMPAPTKTRPGDQPLPTVNDLPFIQDAVIADIEVRKQVGIQRYGTPLQAFNGRNALQDAYEEAIDLAMYLKQLIVEQTVSGGASES